MGVTCQILVNNPNGGVHRAGRPVAGIVKFAIDKPTAYQEVGLWFLGKGKCSWTERNYAYYGSEHYIARHVNVTNKRITLHGAYEFPFEFYLPEDIPTSHRDATASITYKIQMKFVKAKLFSFNKVFTASILVCGYVASTTTRGTHDGPVIYGLEKTLLTFSGKRSVNLKAEIAKTCLTPGERVHLTYKVTNDTSIPITSVKTHLYCYTTYTANCGHTKTKNFKVRLCKTQLPGVQEKNVGLFTCSLPTLSKLYSIQHSKVVKREYRVRTTVRLPLPHANATVEMPVALGKWRARGEDEQPPSYWQALSDMSEKSANCREKE